MPFTDYMYSSHRGVASRIGGGGGGGGLSWGWLSNFHVIMLLGGRPGNPQTPPGYAASDSTYRQCTLYIWVGYYTTI